jgi:hypothetical protein
MDQDADLLGHPGEVTPMNARTAHFASRAGAAAALIALALDKYSWGRANAWLNADVTVEVAGATWQVWIALMQAVMLLATVSVGRLTARRELLGIESVLFLVANAALLVRDGQPRLFEWTYAAGNGGFLLLAVGVLARAVALFGAQVLRSPGSTNPIVKASANAGR